MSPPVPVWVVGHDANIGDEEGLKERFPVHSMFKSAADASRLTGIDRKSINRAVAANEILRVPIHHAHGLVFNRLPLNPPAQQQLVDKVQWLEDSLAPLAMKLNGCEWVNLRLLSDTESRRHKEENEIGDKLGIVGGRDQHLKWVIDMKVIHLDADERKTETWMAGNLTSQKLTYAQRRIKAFHQDLGLQGQKADHFETTIKVLRRRLEVAEADPLLLALDGNYSD
jgi:hypothetical protein